MRFSLIRYFRCELLLRPGKDLWQLIVNATFKVILGIVYIMSGVVYINHEDNIASTETPTRPAYLGIRQYWIRYLIVIFRSVIFQRRGRLIIHYKPARLYA